MFFEFESCFSTSLTQSLMLISLGSGTKAAGVNHGPIGAASSKHFCPSQSMNIAVPARSCCVPRSRAEIVDAEIAGDHLESPLHRDVARRLADDDAQLRLPVELLRVRRHARIGARTDDRMRPGLD